MSNYYDHPAISASGLKLIAQSPMHYWDKYINPDREPEEQTEAQLIGSATHCAVLEPHEFDNRYTVIPEGLDRRTKEGKAAFEAVIATGKTPLKFDAMKDIRAMQASAHAHPISRVIWGKMAPKFEQEFYFELDGTLAKMKPDLIIEPCDQFPSGLIIDLKTTTDASPAEFGRAVWNMDMAIQAAFYQRGFYSQHQTVPEFLWLAQEKKRPYLCAYYSATQDVIDYGIREYTRLLAIYRECLSTGTWPGYSNQVTPLTLPAWALNSINSEVTK